MSSRKAPPGTGKSHPWVLAFIAVAIVVIAAAVFFTFREQCTSYPPGKAPDGLQVQWRQLLPGVTAISRARLQFTGKAIGVTTDGSSVSLWLVEPDLTTKEEKGSIELHDGFNSIEAEGEEIVAPGRVAPVKIRFWIYRCQGIVWSPLPR